MGEVWRAGDQKLGREVAIKTLPEEFAKDEERLARFEREAKLLASLNHPNIVAIYGLEEDGGTRFLVLELVEGDTLADRLKQGAIPVEESLKFALQIAEALEAAHEKGVIHRDLKPDNIKITAEDSVKVLDFGLAKALTGEIADAQLTNSPTLSVAATGQGVILGTAAYMSPEQAKGHAVDRRTDVFAFASVLYECLTGRKAFGEETFTETLAAIIHKEPDWTLLPSDAPSNVRRVLERCLQKDRKQRMRDIGDVALELRDYGSEEPIESVAAASTPVRWAILVPFVLLLALGSYFVGTRTSISNGPNAETRWVGEMLGGAAVARAPVVSPTDNRVAFAGWPAQLPQVWVMKPGVTGGARQLTRDTSRGGVGNLAWSRDGSRIFYSHYGTRARTIWSVSAVGEPDPKVELENANNPRPLANGDLLAVRPNEDRVPQLIRYRPGSREPESLPVLLGPTGLLEHAIRVVPGGDEAVVVGRPQDSNADALHLWVVDMDTYEMRSIAPGLPLGPLSWTFPLAVSEDEVYFVRRQGDLYEIVAVPLDGTPGLRSVLAVTGRPLFIDIDRDGNLYLDQIDQPTEILRIDTESGEMGHVPLSSGTFESVLPLPDDRFLLASDRGGRNRLMVLAPGGSPVQFLNIDEEARRPLTLVGDDSVAFVIGDREMPQLAIATVDGRLQRRIPIEGTQVAGLSASPDGAVLYYVFDGTIYSVPASGGPSEPVYQGDQVAVDPSTGDLVVMLGEEEVRSIRVAPGGEGKARSRSKAVSGG